MIIYEVNLTVQNSVADEYAEWLKEHIHQILRIDGFIRAEWLEEDGAGADARHWVVHYHLKDMASLESYFANHAEAMRRDGLERFPGMFTATRRVLTRKMELTPTA